MKNDLQKDEKTSRVQILYSDLKDFRDDFIRGAIVSGHCQTKNIPDEFKPRDKNLPYNLEGRLVISFGESLYNMAFFSMDGNQEFRWQIKNDGLENYKQMLNDIWPEGGDIVWLIKKQEHIELLNKKASLIYELSEPLLRMMECRKNAGKVRAVVKPDGNPWTNQSNIEFRYLEELEEVIKELENSVTQKPTEAEQNIKSTITAVVISLLIVCIFVLSVWLIPTIPFTWLKNHPNSYGLQGGIILLIPCLILGFFKPGWRKWCWETAGLAFLVLILSLLGGS